MTLITLAQINPKVTDVARNLELITETFNGAPEGSIVIFPEMVVTGYPLEDLVFDPTLQEDSRAAVETLVQTAEGTNKEMIVGYLHPQSTPMSKPFNGMVHILPEGESSTSFKTALPTYGVFDEKRLFETGNYIHTFTKDGYRFTVLICEDVWDTRYAAYQRLTSEKTDVLIVINGSPYEQGKPQRRLDVMNRALTRSGAKLGIYLNLVGGQDDIVFDGASFIVNKNGIVANLKPFEEDVRTFDITEIINAPSVNGGIYAMSDIETMYRASVLGVRDYVRKNGMRGVLLGVSGGIDSALVATIAADALGGDNVYGISMPSDYSSDHSITDAEKLMKNIGGHYRQTPIKEMVNAFMNPLQLTGVSEENLQARVRGVILMGVSNQEGQLVLAPGNKSELAVGYSTVYGDAVGGYAPLKDAYKTHVYEMSKWRNTLPDAPIPVDSITKPPSAELRPGQVDQESLPPYDILDAFLFDHIEKRMNKNRLAEKYGQELTSDLLGKINRAEWKRRQYPIGPKLGGMSFGRERTVPVTR